MKKVILFVGIVLFICILFAEHADASGLESLNNSVKEIKNNVNEDTLERMEQLGVGTEVQSYADISLTSVLSLIGDTFSETASKPISSGILLAAVILLSSLLESYSFSLRYVDTKEVMNAVTSLMIISVLVTPLSGLIQTSLDAVKGAANLILLYAPVMVGIMVFSGQIVQSGGYYATVTAACQGIAQLSSIVFAPMLNLFLALSVSSAISDRVKLSGVCDLLSRLMKWTLTFALSVFTAILSIQGIAANAADTVGSKAARFALSSLIPIVGGSVSEAYKTINGSVNLLRSGLGVFVIIAAAVTFLPIILEIILWRVCTAASKTIADTFGTASASAVLDAISNVLSVLFAVVVTMLSVFLISSGAMAAIGGVS